MTTQLTESPSETAGLPFRSRNHPVAVRSRHSPILRALLADIPEYLVATATAERAAALAVEIAGAAQAEAPALSAAPEQITPEWIDTEVARRRTVPEAVQAASGPTAADLWNTPRHW
ncbi:hypothetical protein [Mycobacteroides abscessus]|uniref:hypothetical protein n=1 Tax=Mycobacteroides abscessus TaxID=36809 RepID=UPI000C259A93|nr:hypothetical protein [Mycobacteroides abscessus]